MKELVNHNGDLSLKTLPVHIYRERYIMGEWIAMSLQRWRQCSLHSEQHSTALAQQYINQNTHTTYITID